MKTIGQERGCLDGSKKVGKAKFQEAADRERGAHIDPLIFPTLQGTSNSL